MKNRILTFILIIALSASLIACSSNVPKPNPGTDPVDRKPVFAAIEQNLADLDKSLDTWGSIFMWSPDSNYAIFNAMSTKTSSAESSVVILLDVKNNKLIKLKDGFLTPSVSWSKDSKQIAFNTNNELYLYNTQDNSSQKISDNGFMPQFSPDGSKLIYMNEGLWIYDMSGKSTKQITKGKYDTAPIWFSDSKRVFYFRDNGKNLGDGAGNEQVVSILDTSSDNKFSDIKVDMKGKFHTAKWLEQDHKLFIFAGWDDGLFYHIIDLDSNELTKDVLPEGLNYISFNDVEKNILVIKGYYTSDMVEVYDYDMKKLGAYSIDNDKENPAANVNLGMASLAGNRMVYLHTNQNKNNGALMISYLADGRQTRISDYGNYSVPFMSPNKKLLAYFEGNKKLRVVSIDNLKEADITKVESGKKRYNELIKMLPDRVGAEWKYNGFAEYGHSMRIDGINNIEADKTEYLISGKVDDMSDGESKADFNIYLKYLVSNEGIRETITKGQLMPHKIKEFDILRFPLILGNKWTQQVEINGQRVELNAEIIEVSLTQENNKVLKVQYTAKVAGMPNDTYKEVRTFEEGKGLIAFENTFDKDIDFSYSLYQFKK